MCRLSPVAVNGGYSPVVVHGLLIAVASLFGRPQGLGVQASVIVELKLLCGIWDLPRLRIDLLSLALADRYLTTGPPGKNKITLS